MSITTTRFIRKPLFVDAVRITSANFDEIVSWCQGEVMQDEVTGKKHIKVRVHNPKNARQTKAFVGDWLLYTERGYKVYTNRAFRASFDEAAIEKAPQTVEMVPATPEAIAEAVEGMNAGVHAETTEVAPGITETVIVNNVAEPIYTDSETPVNVDTVPSTEPIEPSAAEGKRVLSIAEQEELTPDEVRELVQSGEAVLAQDIAAA